MSLVVSLYVPGKATPLDTVGLKDCDTEQVLFEENMVAW